MDFLSLASSAKDYRVQSTAVAAIAGGQFKIVGANPNRVCIMFADNAGNLMIAANTSLLTTSQGEIFMPSQSGPQTFEYAKYGPYIQQAFFGQRVSGISNMVVTEVIYAPSA